MKNIALLAGLGLLLIFSSSCSGIRIKNHDEWKKYFDEYGVNGCFEIYDNNKETALYYNIDRCGARMTPASTFNIFNSLVALDMDIAPTEQMVIKWDSIQRPEASWNRDLTLAQAFKSNARPYFQELSRRIGQNSMRAYLDTVKYGNMKIASSPDSFWFNDSLKITPDEQVGFLKRLYHEELPDFSQRSQRIVRGMMLQDKGPDYRLYYTTGRKNYSDSSLIWIVGFIEQFETLKNVETKALESIPHPYFFALNYTAKDTGKDYRKISIALLQKLLAANGTGQYAPPKVRQ